MTPGERPAGLSRRGFLQIGLAAGGALIVGVDLPGCARHSLSRRTMAEHADRTGELVASAWIKITRDNRIIYTLDRVEMGQGTMTSHAMMVAEELEVDPGKLEIVWAGADRAFDNTEVGFQVTGGSTSVVSSWQPLRKAAAATREMLRKAAATRWNVAVSECVARDGAILHEKSGQKLAYGELTELAAYLPIPDPELKKPEQFRIIGKPVGRLDARQKVDGSGIFGIDVTVPDMVHAVVVRPPVMGGTARAVRADAARREPGVRAIFEVPTGVAVVADKYWQAHRAAALVEVDWDDGPLGSFSSEALRHDMARLAASQAKAVRDDGRFGRAFGAAAKRLEAVYEVPYLAHATMEPMNCTAHVTRDACRVVGPTQIPGLAREVAARVTGLDARDVTIENTLLGGGFGRRLGVDYVAEAVHIARRLDRPVKVIWSREDDMQNDYYRPQTYGVLAGGLDSEGKPVAWRHRIVAQSILAQNGADWLSAMMPGWIPQVARVMMGGSGARLFGNNTMTDQTSVEGAATMPYTIPNLRVEYAEHEPGVRIGFWRSVGHSENAFVVESFLDELAHVAGADPYQFRRALLQKAPRNLGVLDLAARQAGWGKSLPAGHAHGIAQHECFGSYCAQVAEVSVDGGQAHVHRVVCAIDCGLVINPDIVAAQMESAVVFGLSAAMSQAITFERGRVQQKNFHQYPLIRMHEMPVIEVHIVPSDRPPSGVGEPGLPPIAPAVANAIFAATGQRIRRLPIAPRLREPGKEKPARSTGPA